MATKTKPTPRVTPATLPVPTASATSNATSATPTAPTSTALAAARTSAQQATAWHAANGSTMPPPNLGLAVGPTAPKGKQGGTRYQHGSALQAACNALGAAATVATVAAWCKAHGANVGPQGTLAGAAGNVRCALAQGVLVARA